MTYFLFLPFPIIEYEPSFPKSIGNLGLDCRRALKNNSLNRPQTRAKRPNGRALFHPSAIVVTQCPLCAGVDRPTRQHTDGAVHWLPAVPDAAGRPLPDGGGAAAGHGGERRVQEQGLAVRADAARRRRLHTVRQLPAAGHRAAAAGRVAGPVLGDAVGRVPQAGGRATPAPPATPASPATAPTSTPRSSPRSPRRPFAFRRRFRHRIWIPVTGATPHALPVLFSGKYRPVWLRKNCGVVWTWEPTTSFPRSVQRFVREPEIPAKTICDPSSGVLGNIVLKKQVVGWGGRVRIVSICNYTQDKKQKRKNRLKSFKSVLFFFKHVLF